MPLIPLLLPSLPLPKFTLHLLSGRNDDWIIPARFEASVCEETLFLSHSRIHA